MAAQKSSQYPYKWPNGTWHSVPYSQYQAQQTAWTPVQGGVTWNVPGLIKLTGQAPAFKPYQPPPTPGGFYDPALDAQRLAADRGYLDTQQDLALSGTRAAEDFGFDTADINRSKSQYEADYGRNVALLTRQYGQLGRRQAEGARKYGVTSGGIALLSAAKRAENQAVDQQGLDLGRSQFLENATAAQGRLDVGFGRGNIDRGTALLRAGRENTFFGADIDAQKAYQAQQAGFIAPAPGTKGGMPLNEKILPGGQHVRTQTFGGYTYTYDANGKLISKKRAT